MKYLSDTITLTVGITDYTEGDYCKLYSNGGTATAVNWTSAHDNRKISLYNADTAVTEQTVAVAITAAGDWIFGFKTYDLKGNTSTSSAGEEPAAIDLTPIAPPALTLNSYNSTTDVLILNTNLETQVTAASEYYAIYRDDGAGGAIGTATVATYSDEAETVAISSQELDSTTTAAVREWRYVATGISDASTEGDQSDYCYVRVDSDGNAKYDVGNLVTGTTATAILGGKIQISWLYNPTDQPATPTGFKVYQASGGAYSLVRTEPYIAGRSRYSWTSEALSNGTTYTYYVRTYRTVSAVDYETANTTSVSATADSAAPAVISGFTINI